MAGTYLNATIEHTPKHNGSSLEHDRRGRTLPAWQGYRAIAQGEVFLVNWDEPQSLDSRYFGPIPLSAIIGRARTGRRERSVRAAASRY